MLRALKECKANGCHELTREVNGYCKEHQALAFKRVNITKFDKFYMCNAWKVKRDKIKKLYKSTCVICLLTKDDPKECQCIHHIEELSQAWEKRLDTNNLIPLCRECHDEVHRRYKTKEKKEVQKKLKEFLKVVKSVL